MDSKVVTRQIQQDVWPVLKREGFDEFAGRTAWRHSPLKIDVVNFQSFNAYLAEQVGCTTFSFSLNLGCCLTFVPSTLSPRAMKDGVPVPHEYECHFRRRLQKSISQPELRRSDTWFIGTEGRYLVAAVSDALGQIREHGLHWFERFSEEQEIVRTLKHDDEGETFGMGAKDSPERHVLLGCAELSRNNHHAGVEHLNAALKQLSTLPLEIPLVGKLRKQLADLGVD